MKLPNHELEIIRTMFAHEVPFVYMPCGCVGIKLGGDHYLCFHECDREHDDPGYIRIRTHNPVSDCGRTFPSGVPPFSPIPKDEFIEIIEHLNEHIRNSESWSQMRQQIRFAVRDDIQREIEALRQELKPPTPEPPKIENETYFAPEK